MNAPVTAISRHRIAAVAPALVSCDPLRGDIDIIDGAITPPLSGDPEVEPPVNVQLGDSLIFDLIPADVFMKSFAAASWVEVEIYDVYPDGSLGEEIIARADGYQPLNMAVTEDGKLSFYRSLGEEPDVKDFFYDKWAPEAFLGKYVFRHPYTF